MRPILWDVDEKSAPPRMTILFPDPPQRVITVRIREPGETRDSAMVAAVRELDAFTPAELRLLQESSAPIKRAPDPAAPFAVVATIEPVSRDERFAGNLHCPACCRKLGRGDSPSIGYIEKCPGCDRKLMIRFAPGSVSVILWHE